jgi:hypothetical protein
MEQTNKYRHILACGHIIIIDHQSGAIFCPFCSMFKTVKKIEKL